MRLAINNIFYVRNNFTNVDLNLTVDKILQEFELVSKDSNEYQMNAKQILAFQQLFSRGPVGVLQGPPGTGKTKTLLERFDSKLTYKEYRIGHSIGIECISDLNNWLIKELEDNKL